jgi:DNA-binding NarL/FixJ family response regulator
MRIQSVRQPSRSPIVAASVLHERASLALPPPHPRIGGAPAGDAVPRRQPPLFGHIGAAVEPRADLSVRADAPLRPAAAEAGPALLITTYGLAVEGFRELLRREHGIADVEATADLQHGIELARASQPVIVVLGIECAIPKPTAALDALRSAVPRARILALANRTQHQWFAALVEHGADALLTYESAAAEFAAGLRNVFGGVLYLDPQVQLQLMRNLAATSRHTPPPALTPRELQVLRLVARGNPNKAIGRELGLSEGTVKTYLRRLRQRLGARDRTHAVIHALALGLVDIDRG